MDETCRLRRGEGYGACADEGGRSQHRIWLVAGVPAPCQMPQIGQKPIPTFTNGNMKKVCRCVWNVKTQIHRSIR